MPTQCLSLLPGVREVVDVLESCEGGLGFLRFRYVPQRKARKSCPSVDAQREDTAYSRAGEADPSLVRGFVPHGGEYEEGGGYWIFENRNGESLVRLRSMDRKKAQEAGAGYFSSYGMVKGEYLWRSYLVGGIRLDTVEAVHGNRTIRLFPNVPEGYRLGR